jgi:hypothetical protein
MDHVGRTVAQRDDVKIVVRSVTKLGTIPKFFPATNAELSPSSNFVVVVVDAVCQSRIGWEREVPAGGIELEFEQAAFIQERPRPPTNRLPACCWPSPLPAKPMAAGATAQRQMNSGSD